MKPRTVPAKPRVPEVLVEERALPDQEEHRQAAEEIEGQEALLDGRRGDADGGGAG